MRLDTDIRMDTAEMRKIARSFPKATVAALNRTARSSKTHLSRTIRKTYNVKARDVSQVTRTQRATPDNLEAKIITSEKRISLRRFKARQVKQGVRVTVIKGKPKLLRGRFIVASLGGQVFQRRGGKRLPIEKLTGPSVMHMASSRDTDKEVSRHIDEHLPIELDRAVEHFQR